MSSVVISGDTSGAITLSAPAVAGTNTITLPATTGTVALTSQLTVAGPTFSAYLSANQTISSNTWTKVQINTETFDTANAFDPTTNYRFTPQVAGYYQVNTTLYNDYTGGGSAGGSAVAIYKNGSRYVLGYNSSPTAGYLYGGYTVSDVIYFNGSTDYVEMYGINGNPSPIFGGGANATRFSACYLRGA